MKRKKSEYENDIAAIVGKQLKRVRYFELCHENDAPYYLNELFHGHLLDFGCDLEMADGSIFGVIWDGEFFQYGVGISNTSLSAQLLDARVWDVTDEGHWVSLIGQTIVKVKAHWSWVQYVGSSKRHYYPQDVELEFGNGSLVFLSASSFNEDKDALWGMSDNIAIVFGSEVAKKHGIGSYAGNG
jgi:hypothetical protein